VGRVANHEDELAAHHAAEAAVDEVAHDLVALEMQLALHREVAGERLEHAEPVFAFELLGLNGADVECRRNADRAGEELVHVPSPPHRLENGERMPDWPRGRQGNAKRRNSSFPRRGTHAVRIEKLGPRLRGGDFSVTLAAPNLARGIDAQAQLGPL